MPYKDKEKQREAVAKAVARHRGVILTSVIPSDVIPDDIKTEEGITSLPSEWVAVKRYLSRPAPGMSNLERMQRIAGSLGPLADEVWFGFGGLTVGDIGRVIGTQEARLPK